MTGVVRPGEGDPGGELPKHAPGSTFTVCTDGHSYPLDCGNSDVTDAVRLAIAREVAAGIGAPASAVDAEFDYDGGEYVAVFLTVRAPLGDHPMTAFWTGGNR